MVADEVGREGLLLTKQAKFVADETLQELRKSRLAASGVSLSKLNNSPEASKELQVKV